MRKSIGMAVVKMIVVTSASGIGLSLRCAGTGEPDASRTFQDLRHAIAEAGFKAGDRVDLVGLVMSAEEEAVKQ